MLCVEVKFGTTAVARGLNECRFNASAPQDLAAGKTMRPAALLCQNGWGPGGAGRVGGPRKELA